ncbi:MAG: glycosyltransferase family 2 protein [Niabella sp.]
MNNKPLITVIVPTYNRADKLQTALNSLVRQSYAPMQVIVVDDGSEDNTDEVLKNYPQFEYVFQEHAGQAAARNNGLKRAKGKFIASLDSDDEWYPNFLSKCIEKLEQDNLDFVFANWDQETKTGETWDFLSGDPFLSPYFHSIKDDGWANLNSNQLRLLYVQACPSPSSSLVIRKTSIVSGWNPEMKIGDDWQLYLNAILTKKCSAAFTLNRLWKKRVDDKNLFDGRKWSEVLENLYVADLGRIIDTFGHLTTQKELSHLKRKHVRSMVELAKHKVLRERNFKKAVLLMKRAFKVDYITAWKGIPDVIFMGVGRKINVYKK